MVVSLFPGTSYFEIFPEPKMTSVFYIFTASEKIGLWLKMKLKDKAKKTLKV